MVTEMYKKRGIAGFFASMPPVLMLWLNVISFIHLLHNVGRNGFLVDVYVERLCEEVGF